MESDDTAQTPSVTGLAPYLTFFFSPLFFLGNVISPSEDEAAFNLLPNSPVHQAEMRPLSYITLINTGIPLQKVCQAKWKMNNTHYIC